ncbi:MAG TPA: response regulator transcription factor [Nevskia sp.]|nr:response regulator transcription factor [Nevskia sp.]
MRLLIVEDDRKAAGLLARGLREEGFVVDLAHSAEEGDLHLSGQDYDLIVLDWLLPGKDGLALCGELRQRQVHTPILLLTARDALADRVSGLNTGADDYLTKPYAFEELLARVRALLRRSDVTRPVVLRLADLALDPVSHKVTRGARTVDLTPREYAILELLLRHPGEVVHRSRIAERVWEADLIAIDNLIDVHISNLRRKIDAPGLPPLIHTVRGRGFRAAAPADDHDQL